MLAFGADKRRAIVAALSRDFCASRHMCSVLSLTLSLDYNIKYKGICTVVMHCRDAPNYKPTQSICIDSSMANMVCFWPGAI